MLDFELAEIYGYETKNFNRQVKNNIEKFEGEDFMFRLTEEEMDDLRCKIFTSSWGGTRYLPQSMLSMHEKYCVKQTNLMYGAEVVIADFVVYEIIVVVRGKLKGQ